MRAPLYVAAVPLLLALTGCGSDDDGDGGPSDGTATGDADTSVPVDPNPGGAGDGTPPPDDGTGGADNPVPVDPGPGDSGDDDPGADPDTDGDAVAQSADNCVDVANPDQLDDDGDGLGNVCDETPRGEDTDGDGLAALDDACPDLPDPTNLCLPPAAPQIDADNYASLVTTALSLTRRRFGSEYELHGLVNDFAQFVPTFGPPPYEVDELIPCELGGTVSKLGTSRPYNHDLAYVFVNCTDMPGTIDGEATMVVFLGGSPSGGFRDTLDVILSDVDTGFGIGTVAVNGTFELSEQGLTLPPFVYAIESYESADDRGELSVSGTGEYAAAQGFTGFDERITADLTLQGSALSDRDAVVTLKIDPALTIVLSPEEGVSSGVITLAAGDGSSVVVAASDQQAIADVIVRDGSGIETMRDTRAWADFF